MRTIFESLTNNYFELNDVLIPANSAESILGCHTYNLFVAIENATFKLYLSGSATAIRFRGREFLLATQHQIKGVDESQICMLTDSGEKLVTTSGRRGFHPSEETDAYDIVAFEFTEPCNTLPELRSRFF